MKKLGRSICRASGQNTCRDAFRVVPSFRTHELLVSCTIRNVPMRHRNVPMLPSERRRSMETLR